MPKKRSQQNQLPILQPHAAGIDIGAEEFSWRFLRIGIRSRSGGSARLPRTCRSWPIG
jgi:hypothetical protein